VAGQNHSIQSVSIENLSRCPCKFAQQFGISVLTRLHGLQSLTWHEWCPSKDKKLHLDVMLREVMANPHVTLTAFTCPQLAHASPDVVRSFFRRFPTLERVILNYWDSSDAIHPRRGTTSFEILVGLICLLALRELSVCLDAGGITRSLLLVNGLRGLNVLALHVPESSRGEQRRSRLSGLFAVAPGPLSPLRWSTPPP